jgi:Protein of unknown function (DUF2798)
MKIQPRHSHLVFSLIITMIVACIVTCVLTAVNHGFTDFISNWARGFVIVWVVAFPSVFIVGPPVQRWVQRMAGQ